MGGTTCLRLAKKGVLEGVVVVSSTQSLGGDNLVTSADLSSLVIPKLFIYGDRDSSILSDMLAMIRNPAEPKQAIVYENAAHGIDLLLSPYGDDMRQQLLAFLNELR
jgi:pimeloyl-ACP methyl ester carboxylesterase